MIRVNLYFDQDMVSLQTLKLAAQDEIDAIYFVPQLSPHERWLRIYVVKIYSLITFWFNSCWGFSWFCPRVVILIKSRRVSRGKQRFMEPFGGSTVERQWHILSRWLNILLSKSSITWFVSSIAYLREKSNFATFTWLCQNSARKNRKHNISFITFQHRSMSCWMQTVVTTTSI
jgi:hypothetical protein